MERMLQLIGTAVCAWALGLPATASAQEKITYNMAWLPLGSSIGTIVAVRGPPSDSTSSRVPLAASSVGAQA